MNSTPIRKSLFFAEKKHGPGTGAGQNDSFQSDPQTRPLVEPLSIGGDGNDRSNPTSTQSFSPSQSLMFSKAGDDPKSFTDHFASLTDQNKSDRSGQNLSNRSFRRLQAAIQLNGQDIAIPEPPKSGGPKRPPALSIRRPYMNSTPTNQEGRFLTVLEDEKEGVDSPAAVADEDQQTFITDSEFVSEMLSEEEEEEEEHMEPERRLRRKRLRKVFYASYFVGIAVSLQNRIRLYGTLKPIEEVKRPEGEIKIEKKESVLGFLPLMPSNNFRVAWTILMVFMTILTAILTPYNVAFIDNEDKAFEAINTVFDVTFGIDIAVSFLSAYYDPVNGLVTDFRTIVIQYLRLWFWIDLVAILPFDDIVSSFTDASSAAQKWNKLARLLRFPRLYRLLKVLRLFKMLKLFSTSKGFNRMIKKLNLNVGIMKMLKFVMNIALFTHFVGCLWFFIAKMNDFSPDTWVAKHELVDANAATQYIASYYWALQTITTVGFGDFAPGTPTERILAILWMIVGVGVYSFTIGNLSTLLANMDRRATILKKKISAFNNFSSKVKLPDFLRQKVQRFFELNHKENVYYWIDPSDMLKHLPENLKSTLLLYSYHTMIKDIEILELNANFTAAILTHLKLLKLEKREILYREGDPTQEIYFISKGSIKMVTEYGQGIYTLVQGTYFGELEILEESKRLCFAQASESTIVIVCDKAAFLEALKEFPDVEEKIKKVANYRKDKLTTSMAQLSEELASSETTKLNKKPLFKSTDYFYNVLMNHGNKKAGRTFGFQNIANPSTIRKNMFGGISFPNKENDHLETFKKLQDFTGAIDTKRSSDKTPKAKEETPKGVLKNKITTPKSTEKLDQQENPPTNLDNIIKGPLKRAYLPPLVGINTHKTNLLEHDIDINKGRDSIFAKPRISLMPPDKTIDDGNGPVHTANFLEASPHSLPGKSPKNDKKNDSGDEGDFAKHLRHFQEAAHPKKNSPVNKTDLAEKTAYLNMVRKGLNDIKKLKEIAEQTFSELDIKKQGIAENFTAIADKQKEINANVEKLFNMAK